MKFAEILTEHNITFLTEGHHHCRSGWLQFDCPFCGKDSQKWHMGYSLEHNYLNCWRCGSHGVFDVLKVLTGLSITRIYQIFDLPEYIFKQTKTAGKLAIPKGVENLSPIHKKYLINRRYDPKQLQRLWSVQGIGIAHRLSWRIFIPIFYHGMIVSWTTRSIVNQTYSRYISASPEEESIPHRHLLYGEDYARHAIIITEGPFDVWKIGPGAVATFGTMVSQTQINSMIKYPVRAVCFDNDLAGQQKAKKMCDILSTFPGDTFNIILDKKDAGESDEKEIAQIRRNTLYGKMRSL